jgi:orotate phosphoribosyltransferase
MAIKVVNDQIAAQTAKYLLEVEAVQLRPSSPFTWASGWKSPIYCDNRLTLSFPEVRTFIAKSLAEIIKKEFPEVEAIAGVATAGIPQGALVAAELNLPMLYVRSKAKGHGMTNLIEGKVVKGQKVVVIEDLVSTGGSSLKAVQDLKDNDIAVLGMAAIFNYGFDKATENFAQAATELICLSDYTHLIKLAVENNYVESKDVDTLTEWRSNPSIWRQD